MSAEASVRDARALRLDPDRVAAAQRRAEAAVLAAQYHEREAAVLRARANVLAQTWGFNLPASLLDTGLPGQ